MTKATFDHLYCPLYHKTSKRSSESESGDIRLRNIGPNLAQIAIAQKGNFFSELTATLVELLYPIIPYFKIFREWNMRHNYLRHKIVWFWPKLCPNCTIVLKEDFWGKLTNQNFVNILCPITQKYFKINSVAFYTCTKNHNDMRYSSWDIAWDKSVLSFGPFFVLYPHSLQSGTKSHLRKHSPI